MLYALKFIFNTILLIVVIVIFALWIKNWLSFTMFFGINLSLFLCCGFLGRAVNAVRQLYIVAIKEESLFDEHGQPIAEINLKYEIKNFFIKQKLKTKDEFF